MRLKAFVFRIWYELFHCCNSDGKEEEQVSRKYLVHHLSAWEMGCEVGNRHF